MDLQAPHPPAETRAFGGTLVATGRTVAGYAARFDTRSQNLGTRERPWVEIIRSGSLPELSKQDCRALLNHNPDHVLARSKFGQGTLKLAIDGIGLRYEFEAPNTPTGDALIESLKRGDIDQSSFGFIVKRDQWTQSQGERIREILEIETLLDISPCTFPAYTSTTVSARCASTPAPTPRANGWNRLFDILR
jgi:HK97 family phage prohead protease